MANQASLFDLTAPCRPEVQPQIDGAACVQPYALTQALRILGALADRPDGMIMEEIKAATGIEITSICGRLSDLEDPERRRPASFARFEPLVEKIGKRKAASGVMCYVYAITPAGREAIR